MFSSETKENVTQPPETELTETEKKLSTEIEALTNKVSSLADKNEELLVRIFFFF